MPGRLKENMKATFKKTGFNFLPAIKHESGKVETLFGVTLCNQKTALKYAQIEINQRNKKIMEEKQKWDIYEFTVAGHYLSALINGDISGLDNDDEKALRLFEERAVAKAKEDGAIHWHWSIDTECGNFAKCEVSGLWADVFDISLVCKFK